LIQTMASYTKLANLRNSGTEVSDSAKSTAA
jgi:hypothetical protein